jgi:hypothetical protein
MSILRIVALVVGVSALVASTPADAQTLRLSAPSLFAPPQQIGLLANARAALAAAQRKELKALKLERSAQKPRVVCGMTLVPGDSKIDAKILRPVPEGDGSKFTLQFVTPPACQR